METISGANYSELLAVDQDEAIRRLLATYPRSGLQASQLGRARKIVQRALHHKQEGDIVLLAYTSNLISSGLREIFVYLARERLVDGIISSAGGIEEDVIKCFGKTVVGRFNLDGKMLRKNGINRIGDLLLPNDNYCRFEKFIMPLLKRVHVLQRESHWETMTAPSDIIAAMGEALEREEPEMCVSSLVYWCYRNNIPVFSPAITDGSIGDMIYFYNFSKKGLIVDPVVDVVRLRQLGTRYRRGATTEDDVGGGRRTTCIVLGGGLPKNHLLQNVRADAVVCVSTGLEVDACPSSCNLGEDRANNVLPAGCDVVRVHGDATFVFPLLVSGHSCSTDVGENS